MENTSIHEQRERLVAIGEVGLDYWAVKEEPEREIQKEIFGMFIDLSLEERTLCENSSLYCLR